MLSDCRVLDSASAEGKLPGQLGAKKVRTPDLGVFQKWFSVCGLVKRVSDLSVRGHGSLRGRVLRLTMVFGGGSSPMSFADYVAGAASQPFLRDRSTSVPSGLRFPPAWREFSSGSGLLCPLVVCP